MYTFDKPLGYRIGIEISLTTVVSQPEMVIMFMEINYDKYIASVECRILLVV